MTGRTNPITPAGYKALQARYDRLLGKDMPHRFLDVKKQGFRGGGQPAVFVIELLEDMDALGVHVVVVHADDGGHLAWFELSGMLHQPSPLTNQLKGLAELDGTDRDQRRVLS